MKSSISFLVLTVICICAATAASARQRPDPTNANVAESCRPPSTVKAMPRPGISRSRRKPTTKVISRSPVSFALPPKPKGFTPTTTKSRSRGSAAQHRRRSRDLVVKSTKENLEAAIKGETYERDVMYPDFYKQARAVGDTGAVQTFNYARGAETEHATLFTNALGNMATMRVKGVTYYVCTVCGYTTTKMDFAKCHTCFSSKDKYVAVS